MSASNFCCTHLQQRIDSPEPAPRPLASIDGIFAAAALPEDHPHAPKFPERKPELDTSILRSPNIACKIKLQFRRRSVKNLKKERDYDDEAHEMTSQEILHIVEETPEQTEDANDGTDHHRFGSVLASKEDGPAKATLNQATSQSEVRASVLRSLGYLKPLLEKLVNNQESFVKWCGLLMSQSQAF